MLLLALNLWETPPRCSSWGAGPQGSYVLSINTLGAGSLEFSFGLVFNSLAHDQLPGSHSTGLKKGIFSVLHLHSQVIPPGAVPMWGSSRAPSCVLDVSGFPLAALGVCRHRPGAVLSPAHAPGTFRASRAALPLPPAPSQPPAPPQGTATPSFPRPFPGSPPALRSPVLPSMMRLPRSRALSDGENPRGLENKRSFLTERRLINTPSGQPKGLVTLLSKYVLLFHERGDSPGEEAVRSHVAVPGAPGSREGVRGCPCP